MEIDGPGPGLSAIFGRAPYWFLREIDSTGTCNIRRLFEEMPGPGSGDMSDFDDEAFVEAMGSDGGQDEAMDVDEDQG
ncbi:uncharacterized protein PG998_000226 [Apiospora kogelbergensis]|uniref:uncharacterized protein n=1 Tax=Apiospora kogelbergensis TaxID=1337665 RepID=UPI00312D0FA8